MELKDLVKYYVPMRMEGSSPPNWEVVFGYDISKFKGYNVDEVRVALNLTQLWLSQGPRAKMEVSYSAQSQLAFDASLLFTDCQRDCDCDLRLARCCAVTLRCCAAAVRSHNSSMAVIVYVSIFPHLCFICVHMPISGLSSLVQFLYMPATVRRAVC